MATQEVTMRILNEEDEIVSTFQIKRKRERKRSRNRKRFRNRERDERRNKDQDRGI